MKKLFLTFVAFISVFAFNIAAQDSEGASQVLLPLDVYVGDHAEIRYTFRSSDIIRRSINRRSSPVSLNSLFKYLSTTNIMV